MADVPSAQVTASESSASGVSDAAHSLPFVPGPDGEEEPDELPEGTIECSICLQSCIHPVKLPCSHIFCFLCVKGVANHSKRCALCRSEIPPDFLLRPMLVNTDEVLQTQAFDGKYQWFYEGVRGWWQYDVRASTEIEDRYQKGERIFEMLIAGFLYIVDMENMVQYRRNTPSRRRRIKRDLVDIPDRKGVAGLSCKMRIPRRTGGDGGEREDALAAAAAARSSGGSTGQGSAPGAANNNNNAAQVSGLQQQMRDLTLTEGDGGASDGNPQGSRSTRASGSRPTAADGVDQDVRANSRAANASPARQVNTGSRGNRANRHAHDASGNGQPNQGTKVNRANPQSVDNQSSRTNRRDVDGHDATGSGQPSTSAMINPRVSSAGPDATANVQPSTSARINSRVSSSGPDAAANGQPLSLNSRGNRVNPPAVDMSANKQQRQGIRANDQGGISQRVEVTTNNSQPISSVGINQVDNQTVAGRASQPVVGVVQNCVDTAARNEPATPDQVGPASLPDVQGASPAHRRVEGKAQTDRTDHVDGSSDSD